MKNRWKMLLAGVGVFALIASANVTGAVVNAEELQGEVPHDTVLTIDESGNTYEEVPEIGLMDESEAGMETYAEESKIVNFNTKGSAVTEFTYADTGEAGYTNGAYGADGAYLGTQDGKVKFMLSGAVGLVDEAEVQVVSLSAAKSISYYSVNSDGYLVHRVSYNMNEDTYRSWKCGKAPSYLESGISYYSYDGKYFYTDYAVMLEDYCNSSRAHALNAENPYYNHYQYLSMKSTMVYTAAEMNSMLRSAITNDTSKMLNIGEYLVESQNANTVNAMLMAGIAANESGWGTSKICQEKNNLFGLNAVDSSPGESANYFSSVEQCISEFAEEWMANGYLNPDDGRYFGDYLGDKGSGINVKYASDPYWGEKNAAQAEYLDGLGGGLDIDAYSVDQNGTQKKNLFDDVTGGEWYYRYVEYVNKKGIMTGLTPREFGVSEDLYRVQFATIIYRLSGSPAVSGSSSYSDVTDDAFYTSAVIWAEQNGIMTGYEDGRFGVTDVITREQIATTLYRYANFCGYDTSDKADYSNFPDAGRVNTFASEAMQWAVGTSLIQGDGGMLNPQGTANRAQCATIITRFMETYGL